MSAKYVDPLPDIATDRPPTVGSARFASSAAGSARSAAASSPFTGFGSRPDARAYASHRDVAEPVLHSSRRSAPYAAAAAIPASGFTSTTHHAGSAVSAVSRSPRPSASA